MEQSTLDRNVATCIRSRLREKGMSQSALAREMGLGVDALSRRLRGKIPFKAAEVDRAAEILNVPMADLLSQEGR